jgi:hypothetical protein
MAVHHPKATRRHFGGGSVVFCVALRAFAGCNDPLKDDQLEYYEPFENPQGPSPFHRAGQPCLLCHSEYGGAEPFLSVGGTVFRSPEDVGGKLVPLGRVAVRIVDSDGVPTTLETNCAGNFYIEREKYNPVFPLLAELWGRKGGDTSLSINDPNNLVQRASMTSRIGRDGSCGRCHMIKINEDGTIVNLRAFNSPGVVYVSGEPASQGFEEATRNNCALAF